MTAASTRGRPVTGRPPRRSFPGRIDRESLEAVRDDALQQLSELQTMLAAVSNDTTEYEPFIEAGYAAARISHRLKHIARKIRKGQWY